MMISADSEISKEKLVETLKSAGRLTSGEITLVEKAYDFGQYHHEGQKRASGKNYFSGHCAHVAHHLHELEMSAPTIIAGLLHEVLEETEVKQKDLEREFGTEIAFLIQKASQLSDLKYQYYKRHVTSLRKFFVTVAEDVRVIVVKLCDRYHNLQTLKHIPPEKWQRIAEESMLVHANLAQKLNMTQLQQQINDAAFPYVFPEDHQKVKELQRISLAKADHVVESIYHQCIEIFDKELNYMPTIDRRIKTTYSLYKKLKTKDWNINAVYDMVALRIVVKTIQDCYQVLGLIHARWQPLQNRFKDYIATPKTNGYQGLHTTIFSSEGLAVEIQIKTLAMHRAAEFGSAAHFSYKNLREKELGGFDSIKSQFDWLDQLSILKNRPDAAEDDDLKKLKTDLFSNRIFVMTPQGDVIDLVQGATVLDFAFAIHTDLGLKARGGLVNGIYRALKTPLKQQDVVEIITDKKVSPQINWLNWAKTPNARHSIRIYLNRKENK